MTHKIRAKIYFNQMIKIDSNNIYIYYLYTLVRIFMSGNIVVGKNNGGFSENPPNLTHHLFTCNVILRKKRKIHRIHQ